MLNFIKKIQPRLKPSFIVVGAQKAGTTSFYTYLEQHPLFQRAQSKEIHYFDIYYHHGKSWYNRQFGKRLFNNNKFSGEASPYYLFHPAVPQRIFDYSPDIKLICLLRDPVCRAYSQYCMNVARHHETLSFEEALDAEESRLFGEAEKIRTDPMYRSYNHQTYSYIGRGRYAEQIKNFLRYFKHEQFLFINTADIKNNPQEVFDRFCEFIQVPKFTISKTVSLNSYSNKQMKQETEQKLQQYFKLYNEELFELTGINFNE